MELQPLKVLTKIIALRGQLRSTTQLKWLRRILKRCELDIVKHLQTGSDEQQQQQQEQHATAAADSGSMDPPNGLHGAGSRGHVGASMQPSQADAAPSLAAGAKQPLKRQRKDQDSDSDPSPTKRYFWRDHEVQELKQALEAAARLREKPDFESLSLKLAIPVDKVRGRAARLSKERRMQQEGGSTPAAGVTQPVARVFGSSSPAVDPRHSTAARGKAAREGQRERDLVDLTEELRTPQFSSPSPSVPVQQQHRAGEGRVPQQQVQHFRPSGRKERIPPWQQWRGQPASQGGPGQGQQQQHCGNSTRALLPPLRTEVMRVLSDAGGGGTVDEVVKKLMKKKEWARTGAVALRKQVVVLLGEGRGVASKYDFWRNSKEKKVVYHLADF